MTAAEFQEMEQLVATANKLIAEQNRAIVRLVSALTTIKLAAERNENDHNIADNCFAIQMWRDCVDSINSALAPFITSNPVASTELRHESPDRTNKASRDTLENPSLHLAE